MIVAAGACLLIGPRATAEPAANGHPWAWRPLARAVADQPQDAPGAGHGFLIDTHMDAGLTCDACHKTTPFRSISTATCLSCHGGTYGKLAARSASHDPNPHQSHQGEVPCTACHHVHAASENYCAQCHSEFEFKVP
jgi:fumarate reductase flavoprotein subunit